MKKVNDNTPPGSANFISIMSSRTKLPNKTFIKFLCWPTLLFYFLTAGCNTSQPVSQAPIQFAFEKQYVKDGVTLRLRADKLKITTAERITLELQARYPEHLELQLPDMQNSVPDFDNIQQISNKNSLDTKNHLIETRTYSVHPFLPGDYSIRPIEISFTDEKDGSFNPIIINTDEIPIHIDSLLPSGEKAATLQDIAPPTIIPQSYLVPLLALGGCILLLLVFLFFFFRYRKKQVPEEVQIIPPHVIALQALDRLMNKDLLKNGLIKQFYFELSAILRHYIENRFGLKAPEQTSEEFFDHMQKSPSLGHTQKELLTEFLTFCDLVKFAKLEPTLKECRQAAENCRRFIDDSRFSPSTVSPSDSTKTKDVQREARS